MLSKALDSISIWQADRTPMLEITVNKYLKVLTLTIEEHILKWVSKNPTTLTLTKPVIFVLISVRWKRLQWIRFIRFQLWSEERTCCSISKKYSSFYISSQTRQFRIILERICNFPFGNFCISSSSIFNLIFCIPLCMAVILAWFLLKINVIRSLFEFSRQRKVFRSCKNNPAKPF